MVGDDYAQELEMTITLEVPEGLAAHMKAAGIKPEEAGRYVIAQMQVLAERFDSEAKEYRAWWDSLSPEQQREEAARTDASARAGEVGKRNLAAEVYSRVRADKTRRPIL